MGERVNLKIRADYVWMETARSLLILATTAFKSSYEGRVAPSHWKDILERRGQQRGSFKTLVDWLWMVLAFTFAIRITIVSKSLQSVMVISYMLTELKAVTMGSCGTPHQWLWMGPSLMCPISAIAVYKYSTRWMESLSQLLEQRAEATVSLESQQAWQYIMAASMSPRRGTVACRCSAAQPAPQNQQQSKL